jgi:response regulator of citrate/malate metabolism
MSADPLTVLIVDDDYHVAEIHAGFVGRVPGFRVVGQAHTAAEAVDLAEALNPDLVLLDIYLPDGDGFDVVRALLASPQPPAVLVISAARDVASVRLATHLGALHYLVKPFRFAALAERLNAIRQAHNHISQIPEEATQDQVTRIFGLLRPPPPERAWTNQFRASPTLRLIHDAVARSATSLSATEVAESLGISRATAQRYLTQLEQAGAITLELRYGSAGRPEHRYSTGPR